MIANLEGPLFDESMPVPNKCTIRGGTEWANILKDIGIQIVSLANNHIMDHGVLGLDSTINTLERVNISYVGAGSNIEDASRPLIKNVNGHRVAFLARSAVIVDSPSYATPTIPGVAFLNLDELVMMVREYNNLVDIVIVLIHWGLEHYQHPTPMQRIQAKTLIEAGADLILGHHPHVIQGYERFDKGLVAYSLGNFLFQEFDWTIKSKDGIFRNFRLFLTPENRKGIILKTSIKDKEIIVDQVFTNIEANGSVLLDSDPKRLETFHQLSKKFKNRTYYTWWKIYSLKKEWELRVSQRISIKHIILKIFLVRPRHFKELYRLIRNILRITSGKSTNPYE